MPNVFPDGYFDEDVIPGTPGTHRADDEVCVEASPLDTEFDEPYVYRKKKKVVKPKVKKLKAVLKFMDRKHWNDKNKALGKD